MNGAILTLADLREKYSDFQIRKTAPNPRVLWALNRFFQHLNKELAVIGGNTDTHYQLILSHINALPETESEWLFWSLFDKPAGPLYSELLNQPSLNPLATDLTRVHPEIRGAMLQLALGPQAQIVTFAQRFSDKFLQKAAARASVCSQAKRKESMGEIMHVKIRNSLQEILNRDLGKAYQPLRYFAAVEHATPSSQASRGPECGFHVHGQIVASKETLPHIKKALYKAAECYDNPNGKSKRRGGYRQRGENLAVKFGEPTHDFSNRGGREKCLSNVPEVVWAAPDSYNFDWATYSAEESAFTNAIADHIGIRLGSSIFYQSAGVNSEAEACLGIFRQLLDWKLKTIEKKPAYG